MNWGQIGTIALISAALLPLLSGIVGGSGQLLSIVSRRARKRLRRKDIRDNLAIIKGLNENGLPTGLIHLSDSLWEEIARDLNKLSPPPKRYKWMWRRIIVSFGIALIITAGFLYLTRNYWSPAFSGVKDSRTSHFIWFIAALDASGITYLIFRRKRIRKVLRMMVQRRDQETTRANLREER